MPRTKYTFIPVPPLRFAVYSVLPCCLFLHQSTRSCQPRSLRGGASTQAVSISTIIRAFGALLSPSAQLTSASVKYCIKHISWFAHRRHCRHGRLPSDCRPSTHNSSTRFCTQRIASSGSAGHNIVHHHSCALSQINMPVLRLAEEQAQWHQSVHRAHLQPDLSRYAASSGIHA